MSIYPDCKLGENKCSLTQLQFTPQLPLFLMFTQELAVVLWVWMTKRRKTILCDCLFIIFWNSCNKNSCLVCAYPVVSTVDVFWGRQALLKFAYHSQHQCLKFQLLFIFPMACNLLSGQATFCYFLHYIVLPVQASPKCNQGK